MDYSNSNGTSILLVAVESIIAGDYTSLRI